MKRLCICIEAMIGLSFVLSTTTVAGSNEIGVTDDKPRNIPGSLDLADVITYHSTFPKGTYKVPVRDIIDGPSGNAPLPVDMKILSQLPYKVDESSMVAETNRSCHFYVRVPSYMSRVVANRSIGIRFGFSDKINVIPVADMHMYRLDDQSVIYQITIRMPQGICPDESHGSCSIVLWTAYYFLTSEMAAKAPFFSDLPVACGPQCNHNNLDSLCAVSCSSCDMDVRGNGHIATTRRFQRGRSTSNNHIFSYDTSSSHPHITIRHRGQTIYDSGCVATQGPKIVNISLEGDDLELRVDVEPDCTGSGGAAVWSFAISCFDCNGCEKYHCLEKLRAYCAHDSSINYGLHFCDRYEQFRDEFNGDGQRFISCVLDRHLNHAGDYLWVVSEGPRCDKWNSEASNFYLQIYDECNFCDTFLSNVPQFGKVIYESPQAGPLLEELRYMVSDCGDEYRKDLCQKYSNLTIICD